MAASQIFCRPPFSSFASKQLLKKQKESWTEGEKGRGGRGEMGGGIFSVVSKKNFQDSPSLGLQSDPRKETDLFPSPGKRSEFFYLQKLFVLSHLAAVPEADEAGEGGH